MTTSSKRKELLGSKGKVFFFTLRWIVFNFSWLSTIFITTAAQYLAFKPLFTMDLPAPFFYLLLMFIWVLTVFSAYFALEIIVPMFVFLLFPIERVKDPRQIIKLGQRFRGFGLRAPIVYVVDRHFFPFQFQRLWGFFSLPRPFNAILLLKKSAYEQMTYEEFDAFVCQHVIRMNFYPSFHEKLNLILMVPLSAIFWVLFGSLINPVLPSFLKLYHEWLLIFGGIGISIFAMSYFRAVHQRKMIGLDFRTMRTFRLSNNDYFFMLEKVYHLKESIDRMRMPKWLRSLTLEERRIENEFENYHLSDTGVFDLPWKRFRRRWRKPARRLVWGLALWMLLANAAYFVLLSPKRFWVRAIQSNNIHQLEYVYEQRDVTQSRDPLSYGATPLLLAAKTGNLQMVYMILKKGGQLNETDSLGRGVLHYAMQSPYRMLVLRYLLQARVDLEQRDQWGMTFYDYAIAMNAPEVIRLVNPYLKNQINLQNPLQRIPSSRYEKKKPTDEGIESDE